MKQNITVELPKLGESIVEATIVKWFKKVGDSVALDEALLEVATDKINSEIPSPVEGKLEKILVEKDTLVKVGEPLAILSTDKKGVQVSEDASPKSSTANLPKLENFYSPAVMRIAQENQIPLDELPQIPRKGERLTKQDVEKYLDHRSSQKKQADIEKVKMTPLRKAIAENMVKSFYEAPHASLITEVDVTELLQEIERNKEAFQERYQAKLTITPFFAKALCRALKKFPHLNASLEQDTILIKNQVHLGIAVSIEGGVIVPVIKSCDSLEIPEIARQIFSLATKAKNQQLTMEQLKGGTITLTNFGMSGTKIGIPIIHHPEVAILGMGALAKEVKVRPDNTMAIRSIINISLTFDHRVIDGMYGCSFLKSLKEEIEKETVLSF